MPTRKSVGATTGVVVGLASLVWLVFSWFEGATEIRLLCSTFHSGQQRDRIVETLDTGDYLRYRTTATAAGQFIYVDSVYNLGTSNCTIELDEDVVVSSVHNE